MANHDGCADEEIEDTQFVPPSYITGPMKPREFSELAGFNVTPRQVEAALHNPNGQTMEFSSDGQQVVVLNCPDGIRPDEENPYYQPPNPPGSRDMIHRPHHNCRTHLSIVR
jgi:hypothetical protein